PYTRPENLLKRVEELNAVGQREAALQMLHDAIVSKRSKNSATPTLEPIMLRLVELCVELRKSHIAKEAFFQYKNVAQNASVTTLETVLERFLTAAEEKLEEAKAKANELAVDVEDLDEGASPEDMLLATVSTEQSKDRTDRTVVTPWLKFLWESYRMILETFRNNSRLEAMYHSTAQRTFAFCLKYNRRAEFRRLCEMLRNHLQNAVRYTSQSHSIDLSNMKTFERHLEIRFEQLKVAVDLELWQEAFRSVEDIHTLLTISKQAVKPAMMATYFEKLARIFLMSDNFLYHAAALNKFYQLLRQSHRIGSDETSISSEEQAKLASLVLLSALAIPDNSDSTGRVTGANHVIDSTDPASFLDTDESRHKTARLSGLLNVAKPPTRSALLKDAINKSILSRAWPEVRELYVILETDFHPILIADRINPIINFLSSIEKTESADFSSYLKPLQNVILTRLFQQLAQIYDCVKFEFVRRLVRFPAPLEISDVELERFIVSQSKIGGISIRIDHVQKLYSFEADVFAMVNNHAKGAALLQETPAEMAHHQISSVGKAVFRALTEVDQEFINERERLKKQALDRALSAKDGIEAEHKQAIRRKELVEKRRQEAEQLKAKREEEEAEARRQRMQEEAERERQRQIEEQERREAELREREKEAIEMEEKKRIANEMIAKGIKIDLDAIKDLDTQEINDIQVEQLKKESREMATKTKLVAKRLDYLERAFRREAEPLVIADYEKQKIEDKERHARRYKAIVEKSKHEHEEQVAMRDRLSHIRGDALSLSEKVKAKKLKEIEQKKQEAIAQLEAAKAQRVAEVKARIAAEEEERRAKEEAERKAEEDRKAREAAAAAAKEKQRQELEEFKKAKELERAKMDAQMAKQRAFEEEAERRARQGRSAASPEPKS
ncbi:hypothetical protein CANCADRAFT_16415, partial [Tortispora caseinolytica NRRL Y-17796]